MMPGAKARLMPAVWSIRLGILLILAVLWETAALSGLFFQDVIPRLARVITAIASLVGSADFLPNLAVTSGEVALAVAIGGGAGIGVGFILGASQFLSRAYEPFLYYLGPTPKIVFFPAMIMMFGVGPASKVAMGALSCFFPVALSVAAGMREVDGTLVKVGRSFGASPLQMARMVYLPAIQAPLLNGLRLGFGVAVIGTLLAETKLSNRGLGYLVIQAYAQFDMPKMYAILICIFAITAVCNAGLSRLAEKR
jgi:ABC-type nitrate/sulfonate/bicarbonate transport system permease component